jgi:hypothetical protein
MALVGRVANKLKRWEERRHSGSIDELDRNMAARATAAETRVGKPLGPPLRDFIIQAWTTGKDIDLSNIGYGPAHWTGGEKFVASPSPYYFFLAGLVRSQRCTRIFEVGTHYGGSTLAMMHGIADSDKAKIVTVDVTDLNPALRGVTSIKKIVGDANTEYVIKKSLSYFDEEPIDLIFIDADHQFLPTITNLGLYSTLLRPRMIVIDDIVINDSMRTMWNVLRATYGAEAVNCVDVIPEIRSSACGFGLLRLR